MIIGKPITFGSGGLMAEISVGGDVLSTDTITCTNGIKSYSAIWVTDHFVISGLDLGTYTVTATQSSTTKTYTVLIDEIARYDVDVEYYNYLYKLGDEYEDRTGGWSGSGYSHSMYSVNSGTKNADNFRVSSADQTINLVGTQNAINIVGYTRVGIQFNGIVVNTSNESIQFNASSTKRINSTPRKTEGIKGTGTQTAYVDITSLGGNASYISIYAFGIDGTMTGDIYKVWLE